MSSLAIFPFQQDNENNCLLRATNIEDTILSAIRAYLLTPKGSRLGNMVGCFLANMRFNLIAINDLPGLSQELKKDLTTQFPGVTFLNVVLDIDKSKEIIDLIVKITFTTNYQQEITELILQLPSVFDK